MSPEETIEIVAEWSNEKVERLSLKLLSLAEQAVKQNTPNLINEHEAKDCFALINAFRVQLEEQRKAQENEDNYGDISDDSTISRDDSSSEVTPEANITTEDKSALAEFAQKLADKAESMPVTATINPETQEETPALKSEDSIPQVSGNQTPSVDTGKKSSEKASKKKEGK